MKILKYSVIFFLIIFCNLFANAKEIKIKFKIGKDIITNKDIENEKRYLISLNNDLLKISKKELNKIAEDSIIRETIKKNELSKYIELNENSKIVEDIIKDFYKSAGLNSLNEFELYLLENGINLDLVKYKINIESNWNQLIFEKFQNQLSINEEEIKNKLNQYILEQNDSNFEYNLSQIIFEVKSNESFEKKYEMILKSISNQGFKNASNLYSIAENAKTGGNIGWINKTQLSNTIIEVIENLKNDEVSKPIQISNGFLMLKINDKRKKKKKIDFEKEFQRMISREKNNQFNQFSIIYFNKIKQNININEL
jgi:peptidyl-prolyl cis-trans isomerase SurA